MLVTLSREVMLHCHDVARRRDATHEDKELHLAEWETSMMLHLQGCYGEMAVRQALGIEGELPVVPRSTIASRWFPWKGWMLATYTTAGENMLVRETKFALPDIYVMCRRPLPFRGTIDIVGWASKARILEKEPEMLRVPTRKLRPEELMPIERLM